jgi:hypothetical protein
MENHLVQHSANNPVVSEIRHLIEEARRQVVRTVNSAMVFTYWETNR